MSQADLRSNQQMGSWLVLERKFNITQNKFSVAYKI